jgi:3-deoxy-D-manno-octulosonic-acid transferase
MSTFVQADALVQLPEVPAKDVSRTLADAFKELLANKDRRDDLASRSLNLIEKNRGATEQTVNYLGPLLKRKD